MHSDAPMTTQDEQTARDTVAAVLFCAGKGLPFMVSKEALFEVICKRADEFQGIFWNFRPDPRNQYASPYLNEVWIWLLAQGLVDRDGKVHDALLKEGRVGQYALRCIPDDVKAHVLLMGEQVNVFMTKLANTAVATG